MKIDEVLTTYDVAYATRYDATFVLNPDHGFLHKTEFEIELLRRLTQRARGWLDVACGTGYLLRHARGNTELECAGLDVSSAMLVEARRHNPDAELVQGDYREPRAEFNGRWDVTSCNGGAYGLQDQLADIERLVENLARWTRLGGTCFMPVFDLDQFESRRVRGVLIDGVELDIAGGRWSFREPDGKLHRAMLAPPVDEMIAMFARHFGTEPESIPYPVSPGQDDGLPMVGIIATKHTR